MRCVVLAVLLAQRGGTNAENAAEDTTTQSPEAAKIEMKEAIQLWRSTSDSVKVLELSIAGLHEGLQTTENAIVAVAQNTTAARRDLFALERTSRTNQNRLVDLSTVNARLSSSLETSNSTLGEIGEEVGELANATGDMKALAKQMANKTALATLEKLNDKIWAATDPSDPNSVDAVEKRIKTAEEDANDFQGKLDRKVRVVLVKRLRRGGNGLREAVSDLGVRATEQDSGTSEDAAEEPLGASLGLYDS